MKTSPVRTPGSKTRPKQARELTATENAEIRQAFDLFDTDKTGKIYYRELKVLNAALCVTGHPRLLQFFYALPTIKIGHDYIVYGHADVSGCTGIPSQEGRCPLYAR